MAVSQPTGRLHVPLPVHDALRRGRPVEAIRSLRQANPGLDPQGARDAIERLARNPASTLAPDDPYAPRRDAPPPGGDTLPSEVAAKIATGNMIDAATRLQDAQPGLSDEQAREAVRRHASPLLQEARTETVVRGDSGRYGWLAWLLAVVVVGIGLAVWLG